jgi:hypothetical protein
MRGSSPLVRRVILCFFGLTSGYFTLNVMIKSGTGNDVNWDGFVHGLLS